MSEDGKKERLDDAARKLLEQIERDILQRYGPAVLDHWKYPRNAGLLPNPHGFARVEGSCGDVMEMSVRIQNGTVAACGFQTDGCGTTVVCGSAATQLAEKKTLIEALGAVSRDGILKLLGGLPDEDVHCAELAAVTLRRALADYLAHRNAPWKSPYRKP